ncbi:hypothetical protein AA16663_0807 [Komagataeibacter rhaeticus DSM 16663]|nr:hypothetical protein AA16663_0807 [Komagataeibacter rhaeticus DSM 16663]
MLALICALMGAVTCTLGAWTAVLSGSAVGGISGCGTGAVVAGVIPAGATGRAVWARTVPGIRASASAEINEYIRIYTTGLPK